MTQGAFERYNHFNTKGCPEELVYGSFNNQPIPSTYYDSINDCDDNGTPIDAALADNKVVEYAVVPNDEDTNEK